MASPKPNLELTTIQKELVRLYRAHVEQFHGPPTVRWLAERLDVYPNAVQYQLKRLTQLGILKEKPVTAIRLVLSAKGRSVA